eukprot:m.339087 g.339087  ORF g.339087 m.339087 type:complete len:724 (+) comp20575_c0_seq4:99-2270(+)
MWWDATLKPCGRARRAIMPAAVYILFASLTADGYDSLTSSVKQYEPWDIRVSVTEKVPNPFNISLDAIYANISSPDRIISRVVPFFFQNFTRSQAVNGSEVLVPAGTPHFRLRFTPTEPGIYAVTFVGMVWETGGTNTSWCSFQCTSSTGTNQGFARVSPNRQFFETSDNSTLYLLGENIVFPGRDPILTTYNYTLKYKYAHWGTFMYDRYLSRMASSGGNYVRLWIGLSCDESAATPLSLAGGPAGSFGTYNLQAAWRIDYLLSLARSLNIKVLLCFEAQQSFQMLFNRSIYSAGNGGPLTNPSNLWTNADVHAEWNQRLRYATARFGHSTALFAWQLFNEFNDFPGFDETLALRLGAQLTHAVRQADPYSHLVHNSFGGLPLEPFWNQMNFTTFHAYNAVDFGTEALVHLRTLQNQSDMPVFWGECGLSTKGNEDGALWWSVDPESVHLHNALWASAVSTAAGGCMHWWWHEFDDHDAYSAFAAVAKFMGQLPLRDRYWDAMDLNISSAQPPQPPRACNASVAHANSHFPTDQGHVLASLPQIASASACQQKCCSNVACTGWVYTTSQPASTGHCAKGAPCCWLKAGVVSLAPAPNCTAGRVARPGTNAYVGAVMVGHRVGTNADVAAVWVRAEWSTWHTGGGGNASAAPADPVSSDVRVTLPAALQAGTYTVTAFNTTTGNAIAVDRVDVAASWIHRSVVNLPPFKRDIAIIVERRVDAT